MEQTLQELNVNGLYMKLTNEKLFITSPTSTETFALRAITGVGIVDLIEKYDDELHRYNEKTKVPWGSVVVLIIIGLIFLAGSNKFEMPSMMMLSFICWGIAYFLAFKNSGTIKPVLESATRIMIMGASRDFVFDKKSNDAQEVSKFVALLEDTLTSYHI